MDDFCFIFDIILLREYKYSIVPVCSQKLDTKFNQIYTNLMNTYKLKQICLVIAGYSFRKALTANFDGSMSVIQAKDVVDDIYLPTAKLTKIDPLEYQSKALIQTNDIVISSRGSFTANVVKKNNKNIIASSSVYVLRLQDKNISPEYLAIYLNSSLGQKQIQEKITGSAIKTILRKDLEDLKIPIQDKNMEQKIIELYKNNQAQQKLLSHKKILINQIVETSISNLLK